MMEICQSHIMFVMLKGHGTVIYHGQYELLIWIIPVEHVDTIIKITLGIRLMDRQLPVSATMEMHGHLQWEAC